MYCVEKGKTAGRSGADSFQMCIRDSTSGRGDMSIFADGQDVSPWATDAVSWTVSCGIIGGAKECGQLLLHAASGATRAEVAAILVRFIDRVADPLPEPGVVDPTGAEASGSTGNIDWAFFPDGTLVVNETPWIGTYAVSYTHLDVYKRQGLYSRGAVLSHSVFPQAHHPDGRTEAHRV